MRLLKHVEQRAGTLIRSAVSRGGTEWPKTPLDGRHHIQVPAPALDHHLGLAQSMEDLAVQQLVARAGVERLHMAVTGHADPGARVSRHPRVAVYGATVNVWSRLEGLTLGATDPVSSG